MGYPSYEDLHFSTKSCITLGIAHSGMYSTGRVLDILMLMRLRYVTCCSTLQSWHTLIADLYYHNL